MAGRKALAVAVAAVLALGAAACGEGDDGAANESGTGSGSASGHQHKDTNDQFDRSQATTVVDVKAADYVFNGIPPTVKGPNVLFNVANTGFAEHELEILGADGEPVGGLAPFKKNQSRSLAIKLLPGSYVVQCLVSEGAKNHAELGMKTTLTVE